jgi:D-alanyl-D-alanine carboxypeptidase/D-alanyl-D-alanine-endopeptidase (penicillin-binding protein 4)
MPSRLWTRSSRASGFGLRAWGPASTAALAFWFLIVHVLVAGCAKSRPATSPPPLDPVKQLENDFSAILDGPGRHRATWGIVVQSIARQDRLFELNPQNLLVPGSGMKIVAVTSAAEAVGWDYTFETTLLATGPVTEGVLHGDLVIAGNGDPSVLGPAGNDSLGPWTAALREKGIARIDGRVVADDNAVEEPRPGFAWSWEDLGYTYGAMAGALNLGENTLALVVHAGTAENAPAIIESPSETGGLSIVNHATTGPAGSTGLLWPEWLPGETWLTIEGSIPLGSPPVRLGVASGNPTLWFARSVRARLVADGIEVSGDAVDVDDLAHPPDHAHAHVLYVHRSRPLADIVQPLLKDSINLYAEAVLRLATGRNGPRGTGAALDATRARLESWGIPKDGIQIVDGSGLSRRNVVAPETLLAILLRAYDPSGSSPFMRGLPVAGRDGTLAFRMKGTAAEGNVIAKTGSLSNVRTLAGYVKSADGEPLAFVVIANNFEGTASDAVGAIDRLAAQLATFSRR